MTILTPSNGGSCKITVVCLSVCPFVSVSPSIHLFGIFLRNGSLVFSDILVLKLVTAIFEQIFIYHQMIALQKLWKMFFIWSKKLFSILRYLNFCISIFSSFSPSHCFRAWSKINFKVYDIISCLNKNLKKHFVWYFEKDKRYNIETLSIDRLSNKECFYWKIMQRMCTKN